MVTQSNCSICRAGEHSLQRQTPAQKFCNAPNSCRTFTRLVKNFATHQTHIALINLIVELSRTTIDNRPARSTTHNIQYLFVELLRTTIDNRPARLMTCTIKKQNHLTTKNTTNKHGICSRIVVFPACSFPSFIYCCWSQQQQSTTCHVSL